MAGIPPSSMQGRPTIENPCGICGQAKTLHEYTVMKSYQPTKKTAHFCDTCDFNKVASDGKQ